MKILNNLSWMFFANLFVAFSKWLIIILLAKLTTPTDVGIYSLAFAVSAPIVLFANMKLRALIVASDQKDLQNFFNTRFLFNIITFFVLSLLSIMLYPEYFLVILIIGLSKIIDLQSDLYYAIPHRENDLIIVGKMMIAKQLILILAFAGILYFTRNFVMALFIQLIFQFLYLLLVEKLYMFKNYSFTKEISSLAGIKKILYLGIPLGLVQMLNSFNTNYPRYVLEYVESAEVLGYFSAIMYLAIIANIFTNALSQVFLPILSNLVKNKKIEEFKKYLYRYLLLFSLGLGFVFILCAVFLGEEVLSIFYGTEYAKYNDLLTVVAIYTSINLINANLDNALISMNYISIMPKITIISFIITIIGGYILIISLSIKGAALILLLSASLQLLLKFYFVNKKMKYLISM